jgi:hypothetical protein
MISRQIPLSLQLEKSGAQIEATQHQEQRDGQPDAAEYCDILQGFDVKPGLGRSGNYFCDNSHLRPPKLDLKMQAGIVLVTQSGAGVYELAHTFAAISHAAFGPGGNHPSVWPANPGYGLRI